MIKRYAGRYILSDTPEFTVWSFDKMMEDADGEYVLYSDHLQALAGKDKEIAGLKERAKNLEAGMSFVDISSKAINAYNEMKAAKQYWAERVTELDNYLLELELERDSLKAKLEKVRGMEDEHGD